jgi:hypothetical protein
MLLKLEELEQLLSEGQEMGVIAPAPKTPVKKFEGRGRSRPKI